MQPGNHAEVRFALARALRATGAEEGPSLMLAQWAADGATERSGPMSARGCARGSGG